jgi:hypothetical protein
MSDKRTQESHGDQSPNIVTESGDVNISYNTHREALLKAIPDYFDQLFSVLAHPRRFLSSGDTEGAAIFSRGILFLLVSCLLAFVLRIPLAGTESFDWGLVVTGTVFSLVTGLSLSLVAFLACRMLGGKGTLKRHVGSFTYIAGVITVGHALASLAAQLIILQTIPDSFSLYQQYMQLFFASNTTALECEQFAVLDQSNALMISMGVFLGGLLALFAWTMVAWRALGDINRFSGGRVLLSLFLFLIMGYFVSQGFGALQSQLGPDGLDEFVESCG